jgi:hypothetical protein
MKWNLQEYTNQIADYIDAEYDNGQSSLGQLTDDEKYTIRNMIHLHHECEDSVNNTANYIMSYLVESRHFMNDLTDGESNA